MWTLIVVSIDRAVLSARMTSTDRARINESSRIDLGLKESIDRGEVIHNYGATTNRQSFQKSYGNTMTNGSMAQDPILNFSKPPAIWKPPFSTIPSLVLDDFDELGTPHKVLMKFPLKLVMRKIWGSCASADSTSVYNGNLKPNSEDRILSPCNDPKRMVLITALSN